MLLYLQINSHLLKLCNLFLKSYTTQVLQSQHYLKFFPQTWNHQHQLRSKKEAEFPERRKVIITWQLQH